MPKTHEYQHDLGRTYGTGSFKERSWTTKDGVIKKRWNGYVYASDGTKKYGTGKTQKEAERKAKEAREQYEAELLKTSSPTQPQEFTLREWTERYIELKRTEGKAKGTVDGYKERSRYFLEFVPPGAKVRLGDMKLSQITRPHLQDCMAMVTGSRRPNTARAIQSLLRTVLEDAVNNEVLDRNRARTLPTISAEVKDELTVNDASFAEMMEGASPRLRSLLLLGYMGLRIGEVCGLTWDCISGNEITIKQQLQRVADPEDDGRSVIAITKLKGRRPKSRTVTVTDEVMRALMATVDLAKPTKVYNQIEKRFVDALFVVPSYRGGPWQQHDAGRAFRIHRNQLGMDVIPHDLRAMMITDTIDDENTPTKIVAAVVGHSSTRVTEDAYHRVRREKIAPVTLKRSERLADLVGLK